MNELDRILITDTGPEPSPGFSTRVMERIHAEHEARELPRGLILMLLVGFGLLVGVPLLLIAAEGSLSTSGSGLSARVLWMMVVLVATSLAAVLPLQLLQD